MFARLLSYDRWANREAIRRLREIETPQPGALRLLAHIIAAQWLWYSRMTDTAARMAVWPDLSLDECERNIDELNETWSAYLQNVDLARSFDYRNSKAEPWTSRIDDTLMHIVMHGSYHRGQIATAIRATNEVPPYTDYIQCVRTGAI